MKIDVLAIGELLADFISTDYVETLVEAKAFSMHQGGSPANLCANLRWLGSKSSLVACVGNDAIGNYLIQSLNKIGLDTTYIQRSMIVPTSIVVVGKSLATPDFIAYRMADAQLNEINENLVASASIVHTSAFALSKNPSQQNILKALTFAKRNGSQISCDWNFAPEIWHPNNGINVFETLCNLNPLLKLSLDDYRRFSANANATAEDAISYLSNFETQFTCLTCGADGVWYTNEEKIWQKQNANKIEVVDTTGAGDAFWAGFLNAYCHGDDFDKSVSQGINLASKKVQHLGPLYV